MARVLSAASEEPSVLRWLHALDPDRNLSGELLRSSVRYSTALAASEKVMPGMPRETASLFMPMYRRGSFVLGQLYGPMSPNALALAILSAPAPPPIPRSRRFVVDLASLNPVEFVEYEWLTDGKLCVSLHEIAPDGVYSGQTIVFAGPPSPTSPVPSHVAMRLHYTEAPMPDRASPPLPHGWRSNASSWESWIAAFARLRTGSSAVRTRFAVPTAPDPNAPVFRGERTTLVREECAIGEAGFQASSANKLVRMFLQAQGMFVTHPAQDETVLRAEEKRAFADAVSKLYADEDDHDFAQYALATAPLLVETAQGISDDPANVYIHPQQQLESQQYHLLPENHSYPYPGLDEAQQKLEEDYAANPPPPIPDIAASPTPWSPNIPSSASVSPLGSDESGGFDPPSLQAAASSSTPSAGPHLQQPERTKPQSGPKEHVCQCGMRFLHRGHFNAHRRAVHEKVRPHKCSYRNCESAFAKRSDLLRHQLSQHSEDVRFACSQCSVSFPDKAQLALHFSSLHDQDRPFKCLYCPKSYSTRSGLRKHNINKHAQQVAAAASAPASSAGPSSDPPGPLSTAASGEDPHSVNIDDPQS